MGKKSLTVNIICSMILGMLFLLMLLLGLILSGAVGDIDRTRITISTPDVDKTFDGVDPSLEGWEIIEGALKEGHFAEIIYKKALELAGSWEEAIEIIIRDASGRDVTGEYDIDFDFGKLDIKPRTVVVVSGSAQKVFDGTPLKYPSYRVTTDGDGLLPGHRAVAEVTGSITTVGETFNTISSVKIIDFETGRDVTSVYRVVLREGILRVTSSSDDTTGGGTGSGGTGDTIFGPGLPGTGSGGISGALSKPDGIVQASVLYKIKSDVSEGVHLRTQSFGDFDGKSWSAAPEYDLLIDKDHSAYYLAFYATERQSRVGGNITIKPFCNTYALPYYATPDTTKMISESFCSGSVDSEYVVKYRKLNGIPTKTLDASNPTLAQFEEKYRDFVYENYLTVDPETFEYMRRIAEKHGFTKSERSVINQIAAFIQGSAIYNVDYDSALDAENNAVRAFLEEYKEGVCRHFASAATLLYRSIGIPARYTVGYYVVTDENEWVLVSNSNAHAWVEVYLDGIGWISVEVTGSSGDEDSGIDSIPVGVDDKGAFSDDFEIIELTPVTIEKAYDGTPLYATNEVLGFEELIKRGYRCEVKVEGYQLLPGVGVSQITSVKVYRASTGRDVTWEFDFKLNPGVIHVYDKVVAFASDDVTKEYDGEPIESGFHLVSGELADGHTARTVSTVGGKAGKRSNEFDVIITDENGYDVTGQYKIIKQYGTLDVARQKITIRAGSAEKQYDGRPLVCNEFVLEEGNFVKGDYVVFYQMDSSQTQPGHSDNVISDIVIANSEGRDVTSCYEIVFKTGVLKVTP